MKEEQMANDEEGDMNREIKQHGKKQVGPFSVSTIYDGCMWFAVNQICIWLIISRRVRIR